ncbi:unnamed protein product [Aphanomyces euteiches]
MIETLSDMVNYDLSEDEIQLVLVKNDGDMSKALDELLSILAIREMEQTQAATKQDSAMQWQLFTNELESYGLDQDASRELIKLLHERKEMSSVLELLDDVIDDINEHPLQELQKRHPKIPMDIIQEAFEQHNYDLKATADALVETKRLINENGSIETFSYASVAKGKPAKQPAPPPPPLVDNKHEFPTLKRFQLGSSQDEASSVWSKATQGLPTGGRGTLTTKMKLEQLQRSFPTIDKDILCAALLMSDSSMVAAEAMLESTFPSACVKPKFHVEVVDDEPVEEIPDDTSAWTETHHDFASLQAQTKILQEEMQVLHTEAMNKFAGKHNHFLGRERMKRLADVRRELKAVRTHAAYAFFCEIQEKLLTEQPVDLHGLYVQEAYQVLDHCLTFCRENKISKFTLVTGIGNHYHQRSGRMFMTFPVALTRRGIVFVQEGGHLIIHPSQKA